MKLSILLGSAILFATALTPMSAYADDSNLKCRRMANGCDTRNNGGNERISISGFDIEVKSFDRSNNRGNDKRNTVSKTNNNIGNGNDDNVNTASANHSDNDDTDNVDAGNENAGGDDTDADNDNVDTGGDNVDAGSDNTDTGGGNNTNPPQLNSNDIKGFDPSTGLYGPGT
ncbi:MAG: hypothetical protein [Caudoviricetes sp.]|nr:MAG: hypothetical protein [Caudoviricetes sp.]